MPRDEWRAPSNVIALISLIVALISIIISFRGCIVADKSLTYVENSYNAERMLVLHAKIVNHGLQVSPIDSEMCLQTISAYFPSALDSNVYSLRSSRFEVPLLLLEYGINDVTERTIPKKPGFILLSDVGGVPVVIRSHYAAKGDAFDDLSLYVLPMLITVPDVGLPRVEFTGFTFIGHLAETTDARTFIDRLWISSMVKNDGT